MQFGHDFRCIFSIQPTYNNLNNGSFGSCPTQVLNYKISLIEQASQNADYFIDFDQEKMINESKQIASQFVGADNNLTVFTQNSSDAFNAVVKSFTYQKGDKILKSNITYRMNNQLYLNLQKRYGVEIVEVKFTTEDLQSNEQILEIYERYLNQNEGIKFACLDHISSQPSLIFPIKAIVQLFRKLSPQTLLFVDGAHVVGQLELNIDDIGADFYCTNFHKWGYAPRSVCLLWISQLYYNKIDPNVIGNMYSQGTQKAFYWQGTQDMSSYIATSESIKFFNQLGPQRVREYCHKLAISGAKRIAQIWGTELLFRQENMVANMVMVRVPEQNLSKAASIFYNLLKDYNTSVYANPFDGVMYARVSAQIFNQLEDYEAMAQKFLEIQALVLPKL